MGVWGDEASEPTGQNAGGADTEGFNFIVEGKVGEGVWRMVAWLFNFHVFFVFRVVSGER